jgi:hypothetical protein
VREPEQGKRKHHRGHSHGLGGIDRAEGSEEDEEQDDPRARAPEEMKRGANPWVLVTLEVGQMECGHWYDRDGTAGQPVQARERGTTTNSPCAGWSGRGFSLHQATAPVARFKRARKR